jgi:hypothetical protein
MNSWLLTLDEMILVNQLAQGIASEADGIAWFERKSVHEQRAALRGLNVLILQASPRAGDGETAVLESRLRPTLTPCVLLTKSPLKTQLAKMARLPPVELPRVFQLLIKLLAIADTRRRTEKPLDLVNHWWHRDLRDPKIVDEIKRTGG